MVQGVVKSVLENDQGELGYWATGNLQRFLRISVLVFGDLNKDLNVCERVSVVLEKLA